MEDEEKRERQRSGAKKAGDWVTAGRTRDLWDVGHGLAIQGQVGTRREKQRRGRECVGMTKYEV